MLFRSLLARQEARRSEVRRLVGRFFENSHEELALNILEERGLDSDELQRLRDLLERGGK